MRHDLKRAYRTIVADHFPPRLEISFVFDGGRTTLVYEKVTWEVDGVRRGLRYGENPTQEAALYRLVNGNLTLGAVTTIAPGRYLVSDAELLRAGKHPGKINLTDADSALSILRHLTERPAAAVMKHNNPSGVAVADTIAEAYRRAYMADPVAAFGGCVALNRPVDKVTAEVIAAHYVEVVVAPEYEAGTLAVLGRRKNLRVMRIGNIARLQSFATTRVVDFKSLVDGGLIAQLSFVPQGHRAERWMLAEARHRGQVYRVRRPPTAQEEADMRFGWLVETGVTSNSVLYVRGGVTVGIAAGEQDRVGAAMLARDKAYRNAAERLARTRYGLAYDALEAEPRAEVEAEVQATHGGLRGAVMVSDGFFPFRDGVEVGLREGVTAVIQPGGSIRDYEVIEAVNAYQATMVFTGERCFKH